MPYASLERGRLYQVWHHMWLRCTDPHHPQYHNYGKRGICVCRRWRSFATFLADMGSRPPGYMLERQNNDGDYTQRNCKWATPRDQHNNTRSNVRLTFRGRTQTRAMWADELNIGRTTIDKRLRLGWSIAQTLSVPVDETRRSR